ncbi:DUF6387 family protein [Acinetobacter pseudolwoffii]|uniref:DUF6387 family protein n=1 Tax=Acinetobacter pseudolwoffii TaxID=2053287 RepID=UPI002577F7A7|nr:DUF6387 family protein [Acinetobacter pseudolwoffii]MDM1325194.1 hypothetical protein [Acinetobacter pseudolwoffii]
MAYIRNVSELPKWFSLDNYKFDLSANDILQLLMIRFVAFDLLLNDDIDISSEEELENQDLFEYINNFNKIPIVLVNKRTILKRSYLKSVGKEYLYYNCLEYIFSKITKDPLIIKRWNDADSQSFLTLNYLLKCAVNRNIRKYEINPIQTLKIDDIGRMVACLPNNVRDFSLYKYSEAIEYAYKEDEELEDDEIGDAKRDACRHYLAKLDEYFSELHDNDLEVYEVFCSQDYHSYSTEDEHPYYAPHYISVDLNVSDSVLREQFNAWLSNTRKKAINLTAEDNLNSDFIINSNGVKIIEKINKYKVIPFMDLMLWELITGNKIKLSVYAHALFNDGSADSEYVRKTIRPFVQNLINDDYRMMHELFALKNMEDFSL